MPNKRRATVRRPASRVAAQPSVIFEKSAGAVVFYDGQPREYLLILSTYWEFPKGQVEREESETEAALREVREETGLAVQLWPGFRHEIDYFYRRGSALVKKQVVYYLAEAGGKDVKVSWEHRDARWVDYQTALAELKYENARRVLTLADEFLAHENSRH